MPIEVRHIAYGEPAARALRDAVAEAKAGDPLAPVTVVVPSNHVGVAARRQLASGRLGPVAGTGVGVAAVTFLTAYRLAELLGAARLAAAGRRPVSTPVLAAAVRAELAAGPGLFDPVKEHPATEAALVATYRELRECSPEALDALASQGERAREVVRLHRAVRGRLAADWYDEQDLLVAAAEVEPARAVHELGALVVYLPQQLSQHSAGLLRALARHVPVAVVAGRTGVPEADDEVARSLDRLGADRPAGLGPLPLPVDAERTQIVTASDGDEEVRAAVRAVLDAVRRGTRLDRIAVLHATPEPYARLAHEQLRAAGLATNGVAVVPLAARMAGRTLLELLALPEGDFRRQDVLAWLTSAPVLHGGRWVPATAWERLSREAGVVRGRDDWDRRLERLAQRTDERARELELDGESSEARVQKARDDAARIRALRSFVLETIDDLARAAARPRRWSEHAAWAHRQLRTRLGHAGRRSSWPPEEQKAMERIELAVDRLGALDDVEGPVPLEVFTRTLEVELEAGSGRVGRFGDGVLVGSIEMGIGLDLDLLVVVGLAEGSFPSVVRDDSLLPDADRQAVAPELSLRSDRVGRQHRELVASLAGARRQVLCVPRGDLRRSAERVPSRWVLEVATQLAGGPRWWTADLFDASVPWVRHVASFDDGLRRLAEPATAQEHRLRSLLASGGDLGRASDDLTRRAAEVVAARRSDRFTRFDGNVAGHRVPSPVDRTTSPTRLERWATCPHAHFVQDILGAAPVENPEDALMITPLEKGNLVHAVLEQFVQGVLDRPEPDRPAPDRAWDDADRQRLLELAAEAFVQFEERGVTGRPIYWRRDRRRIAAELVRFLECDSERRRARRATPIAAELAFGFDGGLAAVQVALPDGRTLAIRGKVDRIDQAADGSLLVVDYKSGSRRRFAALGPDNPVVQGTKLQLPVYGLAGRQHVGRVDAPVTAEYWFVSEAGEFAAVGYEVTDEVLAATTEVLGEIVDGIEGGVFPPRPPAGASTAIFVECPFCDPDGLGTTELRRQWERKRRDPALARYARLAEPDEPDEPDDPGGEAADAAGAGAAP